MNLASSRYRGQQGISLVELMVAITLTLILATALIQVFIASRAAYRVQDALTQLQDNGRYAIDVLTQDIRMAGYTGCASVDKVPVSVQASSPPADVIFDRSSVIGGLDNVAAGNAYGAVAGTDVLIIRRASDTGVKLDGNMTTDNANISLVDNSPGFIAGDFLFISDCASADLFCANNVSTGSVTIAHSSSCNVSPKLSKVYKQDAEVLAFRSVAYFVRDTGRTTTAGRPIRALMIKARGARQGTAALTAYEFVEGIEDMQLQYGLDTTSDGAPDEYRTAGALTAAQWADVVVVRLNLLVQSIDEGLAIAGGSMAQNIQFNGAAVAHDGRLRQVFSTTVAIRNRLP